MKLEEDLANKKKIQEDQIKIDGIKLDNEIIKKTKEIVKKHQKLFDRLKYDN